MQFTSLLFLTLIIPIVFLMAIVLMRNNKGRMILCLICNIIFYLWGGYRTFFLSLAICVLTWMFQNYVAKNPKKHVVLICSIVISTPLVVSKIICGSIGVLGISFYTFEAISLVVDTYREPEHKKRSMFETILYLLFFATVSQGPIVRIACFEAGLRGETAIDDINMGIRRFAVGLGKKVLIADKLAPLADYFFTGVSYGNHYSSVGLWLGSFAYTLQIYFDFSGYSDMAIGIAKTLGFNLPENFNYPYMATSIRDFWSRWHISLSTWFRDYLYIPLGGNREGKPRTILNMLLVWLVTGIWHGNDLSFIVWGLGFFLLLVFEKYGGNIAAFFTKGIIGRVYTLLFVNFLWVFFRSDSIGVAFEYLKGMLIVNTESTVEMTALRYIPYVIIAGVFCVQSRRIKQLYVTNKGAKTVADLFLLAVVALSVCAIINASYTPFIYGKF
ncbi:alginate O-acetyltransferase complex protein AlgI [Lachnospiraceae bacterium G11]|nr:alginate O-acetyltransferase complex protein AlgI [Lachnospiraceae bacterium G11]